MTQQKMLCILMNRTWTCLRETLSFFLEKTHWYDPFIYTLSCASVIYLIGWDNGLYVRPPRMH